MQFHREKIGIVSLLCPVIVLFGTSAHAGQKAVSRSSPLGHGSMDMRGWRLFPGQVLATHRWISTTRPCGKKSCVIIISEENLRDLHERLRDNRYVVPPEEMELYRPYQPRTRNIH